jgi:hypothetical protein
MTSQDWLYPSVLGNSPAPMFLKRPARYHSGAYASSSAALSAIFLIEPIGITTSTYPFSIGIVRWLYAVLPQPGQKIDKSVFVWLISSSGHASEDKAFLQTYFKNATWEVSSITWKSVGDELLPEITIKIV